ncbi:MAG: Rieske (2Fe-2S) protein [Deltaproteobacteria bacterium]|nr:Rieske (2Fe-2S) protein [Deltaproteobacteria bacterium]
MGVIHDNTSRRKFLSNAFMTFGLSFGLGALFVRFGQFITPDRKEKMTAKVLIGNLAEIPENAATPLEISGNKILVVRSEDGFNAFSRRCTDLGCLVSWEPAKQQFICPCHQGVYDKNGKNIAGPPPRPLDRFEVVAKGENVYIRLKA